MGGQERAGAARLTAPSWRDPRLLLGILLVLASVAAVVALVGAADRTVPMYAAKQALMVGEPVTADSFEIVQVVLGTADDKYLRPGEPLPAGAVAIRLVPQGELVARSSIGRTDALNRKPVAVMVTEPLPQDVVVGASVDVWVALPDEHNGYHDPVLLLPGVEVAALTATAPGLGSSRSTQLLVLVSDTQMPQFLGALANKAKVSVVWNPGGLR